MKTRYGLEIRSVLGTDAPGICELMRASGVDMSPRILAERLEAIRQQPGAALIAAEWGPPSGLVLLHWYRTLGADQPIARVSTLLVAADDRRRGIGRLLVKAAAQAARAAGCGAMEVIADPTQLALKEFCRASGFIENGQNFLRPLRKKT